MQTFTSWLEANSDQPNVRHTILTFLKDQLHVRDDTVLLGMDTSDLDPSVLSKMLGLGILNTSDPDIINRVRNGISIQELIDALANSSDAGPAGVATGF